MKASCQCGQLTASLPGPTEQIVACHCIDCQRRTGSPFGVIAYYPAEQAMLSGNAQEYTRITDAGNRFTNGFCPQCGSTVWCRMEGKPDYIGITIGAIAEPDYPPPVRSVWEQSMHQWVAMAGEIAHFPRGRK